MNRTVVIPGASKGIGRATALHLDALGWRVFAGVRSDNDGDALCRDASERLVPVILDVTDREAILAAAGRVDHNTPNGLDGLVNNAGIVVAGPLEILPLDEFRAQLEVNVVGALAVTQAFLPLLHKARGRIVNVSSINGRIASPFAGAYAASKFALEAMSDALRLELRPWGVRVVVVQPGAVQTPIWATSKERAVRNLARIGGGGRYERIVRLLLERSGSPPSRAIPPERVARVIHKALTAPRPRTRYLVGWDARVAAFARWLLPDRAFDRLILRR
jgi:NAD(P)-dependent dehydrogenase (short-subunit alcohol dehydrogenase family)